MGKFYETGAAAGMNHAQSKMFWKSEPWAVNHTPGQNKQCQAKRERQSTCVTFAADEQQVPDRF